jgi:predicted acyltransferase
MRNNPTNPEITLSRSPANSQEDKPYLSAKHRLVSLDAYRGLTMFLLVAEAALVYEMLFGIFPEGSFGYSLVQQFTHHPWNGLRFWDLIQPFFMFIVGVAMPFSLNKRLAQSGNQGKVTRHILRRCFLLFLFGTGLHCVYKQQLVFELWNVLTQLSFTILLTYFLLRQPFKIQLAVSIGLLVLTEILYRMYQPGSPFVMGENFGSYVDMLLMGKINGGGWVAINCIPTASHTLWGAMCGNLLLSNKSSMKKISTLVIAAVIGLVLGYGLDFFGITPIIKRISTSSFVFASGGWAILALAFFYWLIDIKKSKSWTFPFLIVGMNSIFIYLFAEILGHRWLYDFLKIFSFGFLEPTGIPEPTLLFFNALLTLAAMWYLCYFLYRKKIFFRI